MFSFLDLRIPRNGSYALSYASDEQISPPSLVCKQNSSRLHSFWVCLGKQFECKSSPLFTTLPFVSRKSEIQVLSLSGKYSQLIMNAKTNLLYFLTIGPFQLAIHVGQNRYAGELGRGALGQDKQTAHFIKVVISYVCLLTVRVLGCLPFLWTNHLVRGLGKWYAKFSASKFRPGIAYTNCVQISFIYRETAARTLNWYQRRLSRKETRPKKQKNLFRHSVAPGNFPLKFLEHSSGVLSNCIFVKTVNNLALHHGGFVPCQ